jgi:hypothetical protein
MAVIVDSSQLPGRRRRRRGDLVRARQALAPLLVWALAAGALWYLVSYALVVLERGF